MVPSTHAPWVLWKTITAIILAAKHLKPTHIVQLGDLYDMYSWTKFPRTQNLFTPLQELRRGRKMAEHFWQKLRQACPQAKCYQLLGNHDIRPYKRIAESLPAGESLLGIDHLWMFEGVETIMDPRETLEIAGVVYTHGFTQHGQHMAITHKNTVLGHTHLGGVVYTRFGKKTIWECNAGFCGNPYAVPLSYTALRKYSKTTQGYAVIDKWGPRFIPLPNN